MGLNDGMAMPYFEVWNSYIRVHEGKIDLKMKKR